MAKEHQALKLKFDALENRYQSDNDDLRNKIIILTSELNTLKNS